MNISQFYSVISSMKSQESKKQLFASLSQVYSLVKLNGNHDIKSKHQLSALLPGVDSFSKLTGNYRKALFSDAKYTKNAILSQ